MSQDQRDKVVRLLAASKQEFLQSIDGVSDEQWRWKPTPARWSVGEVAEHIVLSEGLLFAKVEEALKNPALPDWEKKTQGKTEFLERVMPNRTGKAQAPEDIVPTHHWSKTETIARFEAIRTKTAAFAAQTDAPMNQQTAEHPFPVFNTLSAYQWLIYIPLHNQRHVKQIEEVKATAGYPK